MSPMRNIGVSTAPYSVTLQVTYAMLIGRSVSDYHGREILTGAQSPPELQRRELQFKDAACVRPDCDHPGGAEDTDEYFVERIIGRRPYMADVDISVKTTSDLMWLVKWDGYATVLPQ